MSITQRIDAITKVDSERYRPFLPAPKSVKIELSPRCNYRCTFCSLRTRQNQPKLEDDMHWGLFTRITQEMRDAGVEEIGCFYLGESFMNPDLLVSAVAWCKQELKFPYVFLTTNGSMADPGTVEALMVAGLDSLKFSINADGFQQFEDVMGVSAKNFSKALDNLAGARKVRDSGCYNTRLYASSIRFDGEQHERMQGLLKRFVLPYVDEHYFLPLYSMGLRAKQIHDATGWNPTIGNMGRYDESLGTGNRADQPVCWSAFTEGHVRSDGHLSACCFGSTDRFDVGDLNTQSFMDAWNSEEYQAIRKAQLDYAAGDKNALIGTMCEVCVAWE